MGFFDAQGIDTSKPQSQQTNVNTISSWAQPYVNSYLNKAQNLVNTSGPTAFQNQVWNSAQNMGTPDQFAAGSSLAQQGGQGALSTAPMALNYGQMGAGIGSQGIGIGQAGMQYGMGAGQNYQNMATDPNAVGAYMNPYIQQSLAPQLGLLNQQQQLAAQNINAKAAGQGAFGGNRATLAQGLNAQNYDLARQQAIGQGYNTAFQNAQQAQQFGANLGLQGAMQGTSAGLQGLSTALQGTGLGLQGVQGAQQGYQGATQAGSALGNIGAQQGQYQLGLLGLQNQMANQQYQLPYQNLQFARDMLSGLPVSSGTTTGFQAAPNMASQVAGLGSAVAGGYGLYNNLTKGNNSNNNNNTNPYAGSQNNNGAQTGEVWGSPGTTDTSYGNLGQSSVMQGSFNPSEEWAKGGRIRSYAGGGLVSLALKNALKG